MDRPVPAPRSAGFTLLEVMVAMVVLTLIVTSAFGALRLGERSWEAGLERTAETETLRSVASVLQRQLNQVLPLQWSDKTEKTIAFSGALDRVRFIAPAPQHHGSTGLFEYTLVAEENEDSVSLVLYYRLHDPDMIGFKPEGSDSQRVLLVDALKAVDFAYFGSPVKDDPPQWFTQWSMDAEAFPRLVHARLVTSSGQPWPDLFMALPVDVAQ